MGSEKKIDLGEINRCMNRNIPLIPIPDASFSSTLPNEVDFLDKIFSLRDDPFSSHETQPPTQNKAPEIACEDLLRLNSPPTPKNLFKPNLSSSLHSNFLGKELDSLVLSQTPSLASDLSVNDVTPSKKTDRSVSSFLSSSFNLIKTISKYLKYPESSEISPLARSKSADRIGISRIIPKRSLCDIPVPEPSVCIPSARSSRASLSKIDEDLAILEARCLANTLKNNSRMLEADDVDMFNSSPDWLDETDTSFDPDPANEAIRLESSEELVCDNLSLSQSSPRHSVNDESLPADSLETEKNLAEATRIFVDNLAKILNSDGNQTCCKRILSDNLLDCVNDTLKRSRARTSRSSLPGDSTEDTPLDLSLKKASPKRVSRPSRAPPDLKTILPSSDFKLKTVRRDEERGRRGPMKATVPIAEVAKRQPVTSRSAVLSRASPPRPVAVQGKRMSPTRSHKENMPIAQSTPERGRKGVQITPSPISPLARSNSVGGNRTKNACDADRPCYKCLNESGGTSLKYFCDVKVASDARSDENTFVKFHLEKDKKYEWSSSRTNVVRGIKHYNMTMVGRVVRWDDPDSRPGSRQRANSDK